MGYLPALPAIPLDSVCGLNLGCWDLLLWGQVQDSRGLTCVCAVVCPGKRQESIVLSGPAPAQLTGLLPLTAKVWDLGNKSVTFFLPSSVLFQAGAHSCSLETLAGAGRELAAVLLPALSPSLPPCRAVKGHAVRLLAEGKQSRGASARAAVCWPRELTGTGCRAGHTGWQGSAVPWLCLGHEGRLIPNPGPGTLMLGESQQPPRDSQEPSARPQGCFGASLQIEFLLNWGTCPC